MFKPPFGPAVKEIVPLILLVCFCSSTAPAQDPRFTEGLQDSRYDLHLENGMVSGSGADVLNDALSSAKYVLVGEDHGTKEVPLFVQAICNKLGPQGLTAYAVESGPLAASMVAATLGSPNRVKAEAAIQRQYPDSIAFLNMREENDLAAHCRATARGKFELWGLDQEFMGSSGLILDRILQTHPTPPVESIVRKLIQENAAASQKAMESRDPNQLLMMTVPDAELEDARKAIMQGGSAEAKRLIEQLIQSHQIYVEDSKGMPVSNRQRALLMKTNLSYDLSHTDESIRAGKMLIKFGDWHLYKGRNVLQQLDLGNFLSEKADGEGASSLHVMVLGAKGGHLGYAGYGKPYAPQQSELIADENYKFMKPFIDGQEANGWTLYDLRKLRSTRLGKLDVDTERLIYGYDLLVVIPQVSSSTQIQ